MGTRNAATATRNSAGTVGGNRGTLDSFSDDHSRRETAGKLKCVKPERTNHQLWERAQEAQEAPASTRLDAQSRQEAS